MMLESPFPPEVAFAAVDVFDAHPTLPEELALLSPRAVEKRRRELIAGRAAAHRALAELGGDPRQPILHAHRGQPRWPEGFVGAITHAGGAAAAAVARRSVFRGLGLDVEDLEARVSRDITRMVCLPEEEAWVSEDFELRFKLLFSAKETIFKLLFPIGGVELDFKHAALTPRDGGFDATLLLRAAADVPAGFTLPISATRHGRYVMSAAWLAA